MDKAENTVKPFVKVLSVPGVEWGKLRRNILEGFQLAARITYVRES